ncbi:MULTISPECIES: hypothetical protein [Mesorhizobium]|uniref:GNAT family N-acetyltransferase n=1 Tax=Mesorhizobium TaxID=68287 RepID=UPI00041CB181|nr:MULTISPECIES: hypothetical protein [Mesorhizobium]WJI40168.1 hypothetical protein NL534_08000 [Mesorhizobium opportunistum]
MAPTIPRSFVFEVVTSAARLDEIAPAWTALWQRAGGLVFQHPAWIAAWWRTTPHQERRTLRIGLAWNGDRLEGVIALATFKRSGIRILEWAAKDHSDYGDALFAPGGDPQQLSRLWQYVLDQGGFDLIYLNRLLPDAGFRALLDPASHQGKALRRNTAAKSATVSRAPGRVARTGSRRCPKRPGRTTVAAASSWKKAALCVFA